MMRLVFLCVWAAMAVLPARPQSLDVRAYGAKGDGTANDTAAIQKTIDDAARNGGGSVIVPPGLYVCATIQLRSYVTLDLRNGAVLLGHPDDKAFAHYETLPYPVLEDEETMYFHHALVMGENLEQVAITGSGIIDGNRRKRGGPKTLALKNCRHVNITGISIRNSPNYSISLLGCDWVNIDGVTVLNSYADGIDPDNCRYVRIANCHVESRDDAICPKASTALGKPGFTEAVVVTNCVIRTHAANFKLGTESAGTFRNIAFSNCVMLPRETSPYSTAGFELSMVDGGRMEGIVISNVSMQNTSAPFFIRLGSRGRGQTTPAAGILSDVSIQNIICRGARLAASITGLVSSPVRAVKVENVTIETEGGCEEPLSLDVPELPDGYPKAWMFGQLPAYALFARHIEGLTLSNLHVRWSRSDSRPAVILDDVKDLSMLGFRAGTATGSQPVLWFRNVFGALLQGSRAPVAETFLKVGGEKSGEISLFDNDLRHARQALRLDAGVDKSAVSVKW